MALFLRTPLRLVFTALATLALAGCSGETPTAASKPGPASATDTSAPAAKKKGLRPKAEQPGAASYEDKPGARSRGR